MKITTKTGLAILLLFAISCTKESSIKTSSPQLQASTEQALSFHIGQHHGGGIIFYIDSTGQHGLIADTVDLPTATWWNGTYIVTGVTATRIGKGKANTKKIILSQGATGSYAALECTNSTSSGKTDWFLPSKDELNAMWLQKDLVGGFTNNYYWSSSETNNYFAWFQNFYNGNQLNDYKSNAYNVRAVRAF